MLKSTNVHRKKKKKKKKKKFNYKLNLNHMQFFNAFYYMCLTEHIFKLKIKTVIATFFKYYNLSTLIYKILIKNEKIIMLLNIYLINENKHIVFNELLLTLIIKQLTLK